MARRYQAGKVENYDSIYNNLRVNSWILNGAVRERDIKNAGQLRDLHACLSTRAELVGDATGKYFTEKNPNHGDWAAIPYWNDKLQQCTKDFKIYKQDKINQGFKAPEKMPEHLENNRLIAEAHLDILADELSTVDKLIKEFQDKGEEVRNENMLKYGCIQHAKGNPIRLIDGQKVSVNAEGFLFIDEKQSPYHGMMAADYREMAESWRKEREGIISVARGKRHQEMLEKGASQIIVPFQTLTVTKEELPKWPVGIKSVFDTKKK